MSSTEPFRIIISGGGTGGHVYPGIAIANKLKEIEPNVEITFVGVKNRIEAKIVPKEVDVVLAVVQEQLLHIYLSPHDDKAGRRTVRYEASPYYHHPPSSLSTTA